VQRDRLIPSAVLSGRLQPDALELFDDVGSRLAVAFTAGVPAGQGIAAMARTWDHQRRVARLGSEAQRRKRKQRENAAIQSITGRPEACPTGTAASRDCLFASNILIAR
jgi:hypothetical protein